MQKSFQELATHLVGYHPPKDQDVADVLGQVRGSFNDLIDNVAPYIPDSPEAELAARAIHDACQRCIAAIVLNQEE